jgi:hypothetical protein
LIRPLDFPELPPNPNLKPVLLLSPLRLSGPPRYPPEIMKVGFYKLSMLPLKAGSKEPKLLLIVPKPPLFFCMLLMLSFVIALIFT